MGRKSLMVYLDFRGSTQIRGRMTMPSVIYDGRIKVYQMTLSHKSFGDLECDSQPKTDIGSSSPMSFRSKFSFRDRGKGKGKSEGGKELVKQRRGRAVLVKLLSTLRLREKKSKALIPQVDDRSTLYLCFGEYGEDSSKISYTILSISLSQLLYAPSSTVKLQLVTRFTDDGKPRYMGCGVWGNNILLGGGAAPAYIHSMTDHAPVLGHLWHHLVRKIHSFEVENQNVVELPKMLRGSIQPHLVEVNDNLYAVGKSYHSFEMFDGNHWSKLATPPHSNYSHYPFTHWHPDVQNDIYYAVAGTSILVSDGNGSQGMGSFRFDTTDPVQGWKRVMTVHPLFDQCFDRFSFKGTTLVVNDGTQFVLFTFLLSDGHHISVQLMSYDFSDIKQDYSRVQLPSYLRKYKDDRLGDLSLTNYQLVHLGENNVCILLSELRPSGVDGENNKMVRCVESAAFKFNITNTAKSPFKIKFLPRTPMLIFDDYNGDNENMPFKAGQMLGAFIMENAQVNNEDNLADYVDFRV